MSKLFLTWNSLELFIDSLISELSDFAPGICSTYRLEARVPRSLAVVQQMFHIHRALGRSKVVMRDCRMLEGPCAWRKFFTGLWPTMDLSLF